MGAPLCYNFKQSPHVHHSYQHILRISKQNHVYITFGVFVFEKQNSYHEDNLGKIPMVCFDGNAEQMEAFKS